MDVTIDLQTHTSHSTSCGWMSPSDLVRTAEEKGLDGVAVTDHNVMTGVEEARKSASQDFLIIPGEEIDTDEGQVIGLFLDEPIDPNQPPETVLDEIHRQDGIAMVPHPFDVFRENLGSLEPHLDTIDCIETVNSRCVLRRFNRRASTFAEEHGLPATGGSDAHFASEVGRAFTSVKVSKAHEGNSRLDAVKNAMQEGRIYPVGGEGSVLVHLRTKLVKIYNNRIKG